jgi:K+ transporter
MLLTTHFMALVMMTVWKIPIILPLIFYVVFAAIEATYWSATLVKVPEGVLHWTRTVTLCTIRIHIGRLHATELVCG